MHIDARVGKSRAWRTSARKIGVSGVLLAPGELQADVDADERIIEKFEVVSVASRLVALYDRRTSWAVEVVVHEHERRGLSCPAGLKVHHISRVRPRAHPAVYM